MTPNKDAGDDAGTGLRLRIRHHWPGAPHHVAKPAPNMAKSISTFLLATLAIASCSGRREVDFVWFNVSEHEIRVADVSGLPPAAGVSRRYEVRRSDVSLLPRLDGGQVRFTYLGQGKWRVRFSPQNI